MSTNKFPSAAPPKKDDEWEEVKDDEWEVVEGDEPEPDLYKLAKARREMKASISALSGQSSAPGVTTNTGSSEVYKNKLSEINKQLKSAGYNPDEIEREFSDMPSLPGFTGQQALALKKENPLLYDRRKAAIKSQYSLVKAIEKKEGTEAANTFLKNYIKGQFEPDYERQRASTKEAVGAVYKYIDDEDEQRKILADLARDKSYGYGIGLPGQDQAIKDDPRSEALNPYQVTALQFLEDIDPAQASAYNRLLAFTPDELAAQKNNTSFMRGYEAKSRDLENIGMNIQRRSLEEKMTGMQKYKDKWTEEDKQVYQKAFEAYETLATDMEGQYQRYPTMAIMDADMRMQDAMGSSTKGVAEKTILGIGENVNDAANWLGDLVKAPFQNNKETAGDDLELLGDKRLSQLSQYETKDEQLFTPDASVRFTGPLKKSIDIINADQSLTDEEKREQIREVILKDNRKNIELVANDQGGKMNLTGKTFLNTVSNIVSEIAPQLAIAYLTAGAGNASKVRELTSLFGSTFAVAYRDNYNDALEKNIAKPSEYAMVHTTIEAASELLNNDLEMARNLFKGKAAAKALGSITRQEMAAIGRAGAGRFAAIKEAALRTTKGSAISAFKEAEEEFVSRLGTNVADKAMFNQDVNMGDQVMQDFVTTFIGMLPLGLLGLPAKYNQVNRAQQYAIYEAGMSPDKYNAKIDQDLQEGVISEGEAAKRKKVVQASAAAIAAMETTRPDGTLMTDNEKAKYITNQLALQDIDQQYKNAPPEQRKELDAQKELIEAEQKQITTPEPDAATVEQVEEDRKKELAQAKKQYQNYIPEFQQLQAERINKKYDEKLKDLEKQEVEEQTKEEEAPKGKPKDAAVSARETIEEKRKEELASVAEEYKEYDEETREAQVDAINEKYDEQLRGLESKQAETNAETVSQETKPIETEQDVERELIKALQNVGQQSITPIQDTGIPVEPQSQRTDIQGTDVADAGGVSDRLGDRGSQVDTDLQQPAVGSFQAQEQNEQPLDRQIESEPAPNAPVKQATIQQYLERAQAVLGEFFPNIKIKAYETSEEYEREEQRPKGSAGVYDPVAGKIAFNMGLIQRANAENTIFHEAIHPILNEVIGKNKAALDSLYNALIEMQDVAALAPVFSHAQTYASRGQDIVKVEALTEFFTLVADGQIDTSSITEKALNKIIDLINKILEAIGSSKRINNVADLKRMAESIKSAFTEQGTQQLAAIVGQPGQLQGKEKLDVIINTQEDAVKDIIRRTPKSISDARLLDIIQKATGLPDTTITDWINDVRNLPPTPPPPGSTMSLNERQEQVALNKFERLFRREYPKEESWFTKAFRFMRNASSHFDNPYRFVTKIVEDINHHYETKNTEVIPLGRAFEKSAAGKAALAVDGFQQEVVYGRIGNKDYGKIKGRKLELFQQYLAAKRVIDRLDTQERNRAQRIDESRQPGNITKQDAELLINKMYREKPDMIQEFEDRAKAFQEHMDNMLQKLVASGNISLEAYKKIKKENDFYAPFSVVRQQVLAHQKNAAIGIAGVVKRIKGIGYDLRVVPKGSPVEDLNVLADSLNQGIISAEEYFNTAVTMLENALAAKKIDQKEFDYRISMLEDPGFQINSMVDAAATMLYRAEGMALKNTMMQRLYAYKKQDKEGLFIQDVDGFMPMTLPGGEVVLMPRPLNTIPVSEGFAPVRLRFEGKDKIVAINKYAADKLNTMNNFEMPALMKISDVVNRVFRAAVITLSPGFQIANFLIDFARTTMLSRYGVLAGKGLVQPMVNALLYMPQYIEALTHSALGNVGIKTETYKQWMESDSFSRGMFDNLFDNQKRIKSITSSRAKETLMKFIKLGWVEVPGAILEQTHKLAVHQRGMAVEGFKPEMFTAMLSSMVNQHIKPNMSHKELADGMDRLNYEVQNYAGSPNFPQTASWLKIASIFLQFFSARLKGEITDYRRVLNILGLPGEGVKLSAQERAQLVMQFASVAGAIGAYALANNSNDDDEDNFNSIQTYYQDNYLNIPTGYFEYTDENGNTSMQRDYIKIPLRGLTASMNVIANKWVKWRKHEDPKSLKAMALGVIGNVSPVNMHGQDEHEYGESVVSNVTPLFKWGMEYSFNRDTHMHRDIIPDTHGKSSMFSRYRRGDILPYNVATDKTPKWAVNLSRFIYDETGMWVSAITLAHMEQTMGNPTELYDNALKKRLIRSEAKYPVAGSRPKKEEEETDDEDEND